jgi:DNA-directed RNA polymerase subunit RPC12/RpoP
VAIVKLVPEQLMVKCKGCYEPFPVPEQMDPAAFESALMGTRTYQCPHCRIRRPYDQRDHFFGTP